MKPLSSSMKTYAGIVVALIILLVIILALEVDATVSAAQRPLLTWPVLLVIALLGLVGVWLSERTGFFDIWDARVAVKHKLFFPLLLGTAIGVAFALLELFHVLPDPDGPPFPASIPFFLYGGVASEILYRLFPVPLLIWLISNLLLRGRAQEPLFWTAAALSSLLEPLSQIGAALLLGMTGGLGLAMVFGLVFVTNLVLAYLFRKFGFGASVVMRLAFYLVWHIIV